MSECRLTIAVMAYNRPLYLRNCLESVLRHTTEARIVIADDASDDPSQLALLAEMEAHPRVSVLWGSGDKSRHGGLYANMQRVLDRCETEYLMYLQDDTQLVRTLAREDLEVIAAALERREVGFLSPFFLKWISLPRHRLALQADPALPIQVLRRTWRLKPRYQYSDICIVYAPRLRARGWRFAGTERANGIQASALFEGMPVLAVPLGFYCPAVTKIYRGRAARGAEVAGLPTTPITTLRDLSDAQVSALRARPRSILPVADDILETAPVPLPKPFSFTRAKPKPTRRVLYLAYRAWLAARRFLRGA